MPLYHLVSEIYSVSYQVTKAADYVIHTTENQAKLAQRNFFMEFSHDHANLRQQNKDECTSK